MALNYPGALSGLLGGAGTGAGIGSVVPGIGTGIGAGLGGLFGGLAGLFGGGTEGGFEQQPTQYTPSQLNAFQQLLSGGLQNIQNPYAGFQPIQQATTSHFFQDIVPRLQTQFAGSGANAYSSPQLQTNLSSAGAGLAERLAAFQSQYGQQAQEQGLRQLALGLTPPTSAYYRGPEAGLGENILSALFQAGPSFYRSYQLQQLLDAMKPKQA